MAKERKQLQAEKQKRNDKSLEVVMKKMSQLAVSDKVKLKELKDNRQQ